ncbi:hypothetical protein [Corallococcus sp. EGB]|uniref:hypothetical protein n=1 Tax=Corallococcus sp. EGB TaxID=1521117 RepID=UPI001CBDAC3D|nr:hypothetical protein [Corallococcus sp. EGB]
MAVTVVVVSGPIGAGKTALAQGLTRRFGALHLHSRDLLHEHGGSDSRRSRQDRSLSLDHVTGGRWLADGVLAARQEHGLNTVRREPRTSTCIVMDAAHSAVQLEGLRASPELRVVHIHLEASEPEQARRDAEPDTFEEAWAHPAERAVHELASLADLVVDTGKTSPEAVLVRVASRLGLYGRSGERRVDLIIPGPHGDEHMHLLTAQLAPHYDVLLKVGGPDRKPSREELEDAFAQGRRVLIEGAGTTAGGCLVAAGIAPGRVRRTVMVCRTEGLAFDWVRLREAATLSAPTDLAVTLAGELARTNWNARRFDQLTDAARHHLEELERVAGAPTSHLFPAPQARHFIERRPW